MDTRAFGTLGQVSCLTLGGGGIGQVWGPTSRGEAVATVREAVDSGITFLDVAPSYGNGEAESVVGEAFGGRLPDGGPLVHQVPPGQPSRWGCPFNLGGKSGPEFGPPGRGPGRPVLLA